MAPRTYDLVLFGATGFAGKLTARYLAEHAPPDCRWALAGRNTAKLEAVRTELAAIDATLAGLPLITVDAADGDALSAVAESTRVVITTVGPYIWHGEPIVAACAAAGTDYVDLTGEPEFVDTMYLAHHETAVKSGARIVHACGFDSIPHDIGAYYTLLQLPPDVPVTIHGYVEVDAAFSGGTFHSALTAFSRGRKMAAAARARRKVEARGTRTVHAGPGRPGRAAATGGWALPMPTVDPQIVGRSARAVDRYGPDFRYTHSVSLPHAWTAAGLVSLIAGVATVSQIGPARRALLKRLPQGEGPSDEKRAKSWFKVTFVGEGGGQRVVTRVSGGDPGYDETAKMLAESALALAFDDLPTTAGQVTTAAAMGDSLLDRLQKAGLGFEVLST
jgi:saccharopine dehydrogenase (NAD+, L-glutamate forming)